MVDSRIRQQCYEEEVRLAGKEVPIGKNLVIIDLKTPAWRAIVLVGYWAGRLIFEAPVNTIFHSRRRARRKFSDSA